MSERDFEKLRNECETLRKRLDWMQQQLLNTDTTPPGVPTYMEVVTNVQIDTSTLSFQKKTINAVVNATEVESGWTDWHVGTTCPATGAVTGNTEAASGEDVSAAAGTMALLRFTGAI